MRFGMLLLSVELICGIQTVAAQGPAIPGQRVRITSERYALKRAIGRVLTATNDTITIGIAQGAHDTLVLALKDLDRLEVGHYDGRLTRRGLGIGLVAGLTVGFVAGFVTHKDCLPQQWCIPGSAEGQGLLGAMVGGSVGGIVGGVIGTLTRAERWDEILTRRTTVSVRALRSGGVGLGLAVHF